MFNLFSQKETPETRAAKAKANYEKAVALTTKSAEAMSVRVRIALLCKAHLDSAFIDGAQKTSAWQEECGRAISEGKEKPEAPKPQYFYTVKSQKSEAFTYIPEDFTDEVFALGARYQTTQITAHQAIDAVQRIADEICAVDLKLAAPFKALQFLRDELEASGEVIPDTPAAAEPASADGSAPPPASTS